MVATSESAPVIRWSSTLVITLPEPRPAFSAAEPEVTSRTTAPAASPVCASPTWMPSRACVGVSPEAIWSTIGITSSMGIAKPRPIEPDADWPPSGDCDAAVRIEELMPITAPVRSTSGPPELPGLMAASVWMAGYVVELPWSSEPTLTGRSRALTMPLVTVASRPNGDPMATTLSPTPRLADLPIVAGVRSETPSALMTAVSVSGSVPRTCALALVPSSKDTVRLPASAPSTTWLLVRIVPSAVRMMPEPDAPPWAVVTSIFTTLGSTFCATDSTEPSAAGACGWDETCDVDTGLACDDPPDPSWVASHQAAPPMPAPPPISRDVATTAAARPARLPARFSRGGAWVGCWTGRPGCAPYVVGMG